MANETTERHRISVPLGDTAVLDWIHNQANLSYSLRLVIREYISRHGYGDVTCLDVSQMAKRGRPSNAARESFEQAMQTQSSEPVYYMDTSPVQKDIPAVTRSGVGVAEKPMADVSHVPAQSTGLQGTAPPRVGMSLAGITMPRAMPQDAVVTDPKNEVVNNGPSDAASRAAALLDM